MKKSQQKELINSVILNKNLTTGHVKTILYFMLNENVKISDVTEIMDWKPQYTSKIFQDLKKYGYIKVIGKVEHTRILVWSLELK